MRRQPAFMRYRHKQRQREQAVKTAFNLQFTADNYAIATPEFWNAWRGSDKDGTIRRQYSPAKYPADQLGLPGKKPVWVVFVSRAARAAFEATHASETDLPDAKGTSETPSANAEIQGLGWQSLRENSGMFLDDRNQTVGSQRRSPVVAWLNWTRGHYSVNVVSKAFQLPHPIPASITKLGDAVDWVYTHAVWTPKHVADIACAKPPLGTA